MSMMFYRLPSGSAASGSTLERLSSRLIGLLVWAVLAAIGLVFMLSLAIWLLVMVVFSLVASVFTGRPATVTLLWRRYRELARQRWPQRPGAASTSTPRADAAQATGAARPTGVEDVAWREVRTGQGAESERE